MKKIVGILVMMLLIGTVLPITGITESSKIELETAVYQCIPPPQNMIGWWTGDSTTSDIIGNNDGTWIGNEKYSTGVVDNAFDFDGNSYVEIPDHSSLDLGLNSFTIDFWMEIGSSYFGIIGKYDEQTKTGFAVSMDLIVGGEPSSWVFIVDINQYQFTNSYTGYYGDIIFVAIVVDRTIPDGVIIYINDYASQHDGQSIGNINNDEPLTIGSATSLYPYMDGFIDEVEIFDRALSGSEILAIYNAGGAGKCKPLELSITTMYSQPCVAPCDQITYRINYQRSTAIDLHNVVITDHLPVYTLFRNANLGGYYDSSTGLVTWNLGTVTTDGSVRFNVIVDATAPLGGIIQNVATFSSDETGATNAYVDVPICFYIKLIEPQENSLYIFGKKILDLKKGTICIGKVSIAADILDNATGINRVEFYIDDELKGTDYTAPYSWTWTTPAFFSHSIKAVAYNQANNSASDEIIVGKFF
jgi:hypothetical protein